MRAPDRGPPHGQWCSQWLLVLGFSWFCSSSILPAALGAESVHHISMNVFGDLFGVAGQKQEGHHVTWLVMVQVDISFEQEAP